jgi:hypothetical protein
VFGAQWTAATTVATLLALRGVFMGVSALDRSVLLNAGHAGGELRLIAVLSAVHCGLVAVLASQGVNVLAGVLLVEAVVLAPVRPYLIRRWLGVPYRAYSGALRVTFSALLAGGAVYLTVTALSVTGLGLYVVVVGLGGLAYSVLVLVLARPVVTETRAALDLLRARRSRSSPVVAT